MLAFLQFKTFQNEDDFFRRDSLLLDENSKSPLPGNLRRRHELAEDSTSTKASETDAVCEIKNLRK